jgi:hypothetical protein
MVTTTFPFGLFRDAQLLIHMQSRRKFSNSNDFFMKTYNFVDCNESLDRVVIRKSVATLGAHNRIGTLLHKLDQTLIVDSAPTASHAAA